LCSEGIMCIKGLEFKVFGSKYVFCSFGLEETRHKRVNSLNACKLQRLLGYGELGVSLIAFEKLLAPLVV